MSFLLYRIDEASHRYCGKEELVGAFSLWGEKRVGSKMRWFPIRQNRRLVCHGEKSTCGFGPSQGQRKRRIRNTSSFSMISSLKVRKELLVESTR